jgi:hypothetical protein
LGQSAVRWNAGATAATELDRLPPTSTELRYFAENINGNGTVLGEAIEYASTIGSNVGARVIRWDAAGAVTQLDPLGINADGFSFAFANDLNAAGTAVGYAEKYDAAGNSLGYRAVRWDAAGSTAAELGHLGTDPAGVTIVNARAINDAGVIVGEAETYDGAGAPLGERAVYWPGGEAAIDLNTLVDPASGWLLSQAHAISSTGWVAGLGYFDPDGAGGQDAYRRLYLLQLPSVSFSADFDEDIDVDADDLTDWRGGFGVTGTATHMQGDADADADVDGADFVMWQRQLGSMASIPATLAVPEPTAILVALAAFAAAARRGA